MIGFRNRKSAASARSLAYSSSPLLAEKTPPWRSRLIVGFVAVGFIVLLGRSAYIQVIGTDFYVKQGEKRYVQNLDVPASRGRIVDRNGLILATSVSAVSVWAIPKEFEATPQQRRQLLRLLGLTGRELDERLAGGSTSFAWVRRQIDEDVWREVKALGIKGLYDARAYKRKYPEGEAAAHVVGFTNVEDRGQEGVELAFEKDLEGRDGQRGVVKDRFGRVVEDYGDMVDPADGRDIQLSIDTKVQFFAYQRIRDTVTEQKARAGSVVVLDVATGEVLALANYPSFNPAQRGSLAREQFSERARNRALTDVFEPGSVMKPFVAAWAMETKRANPNTVISTASFSVGGQPIHDTHPRESMTLAEVIQKSSNIGAAKLAMQMEPKELWELYSSVGFGQKPQIDFPGAVTGKLRPYKSWKPVDQSRLAYGYGLSASLLQMARAYTVFARDGDVIPVSMLRQAKPATGVRVLSPEVARQTRQMLALAAGPGGTAQKAQTIGYSVGGKTGTAHKLEGKEYARDKYRSWFVGIAPIKNPRIVVAVMVDEPGAGVHYGGDVAAPVFSQVVQQSLRLLGVPADIEVRPQIIAGNEPGLEGPAWR